MSYDPYNDPLNPVRPKGKGPDVSNSNVDGDGVTEGFTCAQEWVTKWMPDGPNGGSYDTGPDVADGD